jgi:hypothetical protein
MLKRNDAEQCPKRNAETQCCCTGAMSPKRNAKLNSKVHCTVKKMYLFRETIPPKLQKR